MKYLSSLYCKKAYDTGNYPLDSDVSGWISPAGKIYFITFDENEHSDLLLAIHDAGEYSPSGSAIRYFTENREKEDYSSDENNSGISVDYFMAMATYDGWIRFFGGNDNRWSGMQGDIVNFECYDKEVLKKLHSFIKKEKVRVRTSEICVEIPNTPYFFEGTLEQFIENGLDLRLHRILAKKKKADFGGDFQNIYDIRPDSGNVNPGKNREYLKQQTDFYPHKTSEEDSEFVHTHPEHCPRYDLRKLKVVDDPDESESEFS